MRRLLPFILLIAFSIGSTELLELIKLPQLVSHFYEHQDKNPKLTFFHFIKLHYGQADDGDGDRSSDEELPFKSGKSDFAHFKETKITTFNLFSFSFIKNAISVVTSEYLGRLSQIDIQTLLQPPRKNF